MRPLAATIAVLAALALAAAAAAEDMGFTLSSPITLEQAVSYALAHHPALRASAAIEDQADAQADAARARYLPYGDIGLQENRATGNVVPGAHFTMAGIPPISGPPRDRVFDSGDWGSTAGLSIWWDIAHLSQKIALADAAMAQGAGARAGAQAQTLDVAYGAADAFAASVEAGERVKAARVSVSRAQTFETTVQALVRSGLRPGADGARAAAETAFEQTLEIRAEEGQRLAQTQLAQALGAAGAEIAVVPGRLAQEAGRGTPQQEGLRRNPLIARANDEERAARDRAHAALLEFIPRVEIATALFGRANGLFPGGMNLGFAQGLVPDTPNWAAGVVVTIPILQYPEIRARAQGAAADARLSAARRDQIAQQVRTEIDSARAIVDSARKIAAQARVSLESSRAALSQAQARYKAGLYGIDPVAESLRLLAEADAENAVARVDIWRARLLHARAVGDLGPLMAEIEQASGGH